MDFSFRSDLTVQTAGETLRNDDVAFFIGEVGKLRWDEAQYRTEDDKGQSIFS
jgi:hypothetical protein